MKCDRFLVECDAKESDEMKRSSISEEQIIAILKEPEARVALAMGGRGTKQNVWSAETPSA